MFQPTIVHPETPPAVRTFVGQVMDLYFADVHAMVRLPRPEVGITEACNFAIAAVLVNVISGVSTVLYVPPPNRNNTGKKFQQALRDFFPSNAEPAHAVRDPEQGGKLAYETLRTPMAHAFGLQDPEPVGPVMPPRIIFIRLLDIRRSAPLAISSFLRLGRFQRNQRIHLRCFTSRHTRGAQYHWNQKHGDSDIRLGVPRTDTVQKWSELNRRQRRNHQSEAAADRRHHEPVANRDPHQVARAGAERRSNAELTCPRPDDLCGDRIYTAQPEK